MHNKTNLYQFHPIEKDLICYHNISRNSQKDSALPYHRHNAYEIYLFIQGNTIFSIEQCCYQLKPGHLAVINPNELHRSICLDEQPYERYGINIKELLLDRLSSRQTNLSACFNHPPGINNLVQLNESQIVRFISLFTNLQNACQHDRNFGYDLLIEAELTKLLISINRLFQEPVLQSANLMPVLVKDTMAYIQQHLQDNLSLDMLAEHFYLNGSYISQQFKKYTGLTIRNYILDQKIHLAKSLLLEGKNVSEACILAGFSDYSNFIRSFTKLTGISPGKFKRQISHPDMQK